VRLRRNGGRRLVGYKLYWNDGCKYANKYVRQTVNKHRVSSKNVSVVRVFSADGYPFAKYRGPFVRERPDRFYPSGRTDGVKHDRVAYGPP